MAACDEGPPNETAPAPDPRSELLGEQLTHARNQIIELDKRITALESAAAAPRSAGPADHPPDLAVALPQAAAAGSIATATTIALRDTAIFVDGKEVADADLDATLKAIVAADPDASVILSVDDRPYGEVIKLLDRIKSQGITKFSLAVAPPEPKVIPSTPTHRGPTKGHSPDLKDPFKP